MVTRSLTRPVDLLPHQQEKYDQEHSALVLAQKALAEASRAEKEAKERVAKLEDKILVNDKAGRNADEQRKELKAEILRMQASLLLEIELGGGWQPGLHTDTAVSHLCARAPLRPCRFRFRARSRLLRTRPRRLSTSSGR